MSSQHTTPAEYLTTLREQIAATFNLDELRLLTFDLGVNYEELRGETLSVKVQALLEHLAQRDRLPALLDYLKQQRPGQAWESYLPAEPEAQSPYKGLRFFDEADAPLFFGRERLTAELIDHLRHHRFLAVVGASGSGKSSIVRAGIIPAVRGGAIVDDSGSSGANSAQWPIHVITPGDEPLKALATRLTRDSESVTAAKTLLADLWTGADSLDLFLYRQMGAGNNGRLLLVVDQFEELFTQCNDKAARQLFVDALVTAVTSGQQGRLKLILTLRADFYAFAVQLDSLRPLLETRQKIVGAMSQAELRQVIEGPAAQGNWHFQPGLVETILQDVGREPGALPLLSHALQETWARREGRTLTLAGYQAAGGVRKAIAQTADTVYAGLTPEQQAIARNIFLRLTELGERTEDTRRRALLDELLPDGEGDSRSASETTAVQEVLDLLARRRLVTLNEERLPGTVSQTYAEVSHEALIREWPELRRWLDENREGLRLQRQLAEAAQAWADNNRDDSYLYRGARLMKIEASFADSDRQLSDLERSFLNASREVGLAEERAKVADRQRIRKAGLFGMIGGAAGFSLSYLLIYSGQIDDQALLAVLTLLRVLLGVVGGLLFISLVDMSVSWYQGRRDWVPWLLGGSGGAIAFAFLLFFDALLKESGPGSEIFVIVAGIEGAIWGFAAGIGRVWLLKTKRPLWQTLPTIGVSTAIVLLTVEQLGQTFRGASWVSLAIVGALVPLSILVAAQLAQSRSDSTSFNGRIIPERLPGEVP